jgi:tRNA G18 (ribose-2'-O)-methylase SpoU
LDKTRIPLEIAIENLAHDFNIGTIVRNADAFNVARVHIIGKRKYNRRGAMVTDKYLHIDHFATVDEFVADAHARGIKIVAVDNNRPEAKALAKTTISRDSVLVFGSESDGISQELLDKSDQVFYIEQLGSTRSINVGCASAIAMYEAVRQLGLLPKDA